MGKSKIITLSVLVLIFIFGSVIVSLVSAQEDYHVYDNFDDGVIDTDLWGVSGPVSERDGKMFLDTEGMIYALKENLIGMSFSVIGHQNIDVGEHVNIHLATQTPTGDLVLVGEYIDINPPTNPGDPPLINNYVFCQWYEDGIIDLEHLHHVDLQLAQWGVTYIFGLEYTPEGLILVNINGQVVYSFSVPGVDIAYSQGGAKFWFKADSVEGGDVTAEIDWAKAKELPIPDVKANNSDGPITLYQNDTLTITVSLNNNGITDNADWWLAADTPFGLYFYTFSGWVPYTEPAYQHALFYLPTYEVFSTSISWLQEGTYTFYFGVDMVMDGIITWDSLYYDTVEVTATD